MRLLRFFMIDHGCDQESWGGFLSDFIRSTLRGIGQAIFLTSSLSGLLCLIGISLHSLQLGAAALAGGVIGTTVALLLKAERSEVERGIFGYNSCLIAIAMLVFLGENGTGWVMSLLAAGFVSAVMVVLSRYKGLSLPPLTAPFVASSWVFIGLTRLVVEGGAVEAAEVGAVASIGIFKDWGLIEGMLAGIAQVFLVPNPISGAVIALAFLLESRPKLLLVCLAGFGGAAVATWMAEADTAIRTGVFGFNAILAAIALGTVLLKPGPGSFALAAMAIAILPIVQTALMTVFGLVGLPALTLPFLMVTWVVLLLRKSGPSLRRTA